MCYDTKWYILRYLYFGVFRAKSMPDQTHNKMEYIDEMAVWTLRKCLFVPIRILIKSL